MKRLFLIFSRASCLILLLSNSVSAQTSDEASIRTLRAESNKAILAHDLSGFGQTMLPSIEVTRGSGSHVSGRDSVLASVAIQFKDPTFLGYVRFTDSIQVSTIAPLAAEHGHWTGRFKRPDGIQTITGTYLSMWSKTEQGWKIRSELFVSLACSGSAACGK
ncbi:YybH family protein [Spirosoma aerophilum]